MYGDVTLLCNGRFYLAYTRRIIKQTKKLAVIHNIYCFNLRIFKMVCGVLINIPINCVRNVVCRTAITKYFFRLKF